MEEEEEKKIIFNIWFYTSVKPVVWQWGGESGWD
jgi:hypothetical protein